MKKNISTYIFYVLFFISILLMDEKLKAQDSLITLETKKTALVMRADAQKRLHYIYLGVKLDNRSDYSALPLVEQTGGDYTGMYNSVYTPSGSRNLLEPAIT